MGENDAGRLSPLNTDIVKNHNVPIQLTDLSEFDDTYVFLKERFNEEMKRADEQMYILSKAIKSFYNQELMIQESINQNMIDWDTIANSPLVEGIGPKMMLKLQFDLSEFEPNEVSVTVADDVVTVKAVHQENDDDHRIFKEYVKAFQLPKGIDPALIIPLLSREGILTLKAPLPSIQ